MSEILGALFKYMMVVIGVGAVALVLYQAFAVDKTGKAISDTALLQAEIQSTYSGQNNFTTLTDTIGLKLAPKSMISGTTLTNPWGGAVHTVVNSGNSAQFDISHELVPNDSCGKFISSMSSIVGLKINGTAQTIPMDAGTALTTCAATNTLVFTYNR